MKWAFVFVVPALYLLSSCAPAGPTVPIIKPANKPAEMFAQESAACAQYATQQSLGGHANFDDDIAAAVLHERPPAGASLQASPQQFYDLAYAECMVRQGNILPGYAPRAAEPTPVRRGHRARRRISTPAQSGQPAFVEPPPVEK